MADEGDVVVYTIVVLVTVIVLGTVVSVLDLLFLRLVLRLFGR